MGRCALSEVDGIAVVGVAARFPGADDCEQFWENLKNVACSITEVPPDRWDAARYYSRDGQEPNKSVSKWGGFISGVDLFDPMFFGISPREARMMDPQQRILLELAWACLEDAGYAEDRMRGSRTGVFVGAMNFDYRERLNESVGAIAGHMATGAYSALIANRISYHFDWHGPSVTVDTACSSSLVALHQATQSLLHGECAQALVGGVSVLCSPTHYVSFSKTGMLSPDGLCRSFDESANGYVRGEGAGLVLLKPLAQAIQDQNRIYGVIRGTATNHGGKVRTVTYPNPLAQADVIALAHERAGIAPDTVSYIEAHGTGTPKGDPIEISGLKTAFSRLAEHFGCPLPAHSCGIASLKANVGHLEAVAGIAGVIKVLLAMKHRTLPGLAHFRQLNHRIDLSNSPFYIVDKTCDWPTRYDSKGRRQPRRAGISSFGFGGVNAHAVVEEFVGHEADVPLSATAAPSWLTSTIVLSARSPDRLRESARRLAEWLDRTEYDGAVLADVAYTLQVGRLAMAHRLAMDVSSINELRRKLAAWLAAEAEIDGVWQGEAKAGKDAQATLGTEESADLVAGLLAKGKMAKVRAMWAQGLVVDWMAMYEGDRPRRIGLPTYPFARESLWVTANGAAAEAATPAERSDSVRQALDAGLLYFEERWVEEGVGRGAGRRLETLLCFASSPAMREAIQQHFAAPGRGVRVVFVADADADARPDPTFERVAHGEPQSYNRLFERLRATGATVDAVLYLWALEDGRFVSDCEPIVSLLKACRATGIVDGPVLLAAQGGDDEQRCHWESWIGFERSAVNVLAGMPVVAVYEIADGLPDFNGLTRWAARLDAEIQADVLRSSVHRAQMRQVCRTLPATVGLQQEVVSKRLRRGGTYLITGGLGGLGRLFAEYLSSRYAANVVLVGRSPLDDTKQRQLDALMGVGGTVLYLQGDVADRARMADCIDIVRQRFGGLNGVLHAAGVEAWSGIQDTSWADFVRVLQPKVAGTLVLDELLADAPLDFFCHFSSSSAVIGDFGACSYAVGNRFQMAHARLRQARRVSGRTLAINWPLWRGGGMHVGDEQSTQLYLQVTGQRLLDAAEGLAAFERLCAADVSQCLVMAGDADRIRRLLRLEQAAPRTVIDALTVVGAAPFAPEAAEHDALPLQQRVEQDLLLVAAELLQVNPDRLELDRNLAEFGFDSINLAALASTLSQRYGIYVVPALFFSYPTLERLAGHLVERHSSVVKITLQHSAVASVDTGAVRDVAPTPLAPVSASDEVPGDEAIAVIGMSGRFPGACDIDGLWRILAEGRSAISRPPADRVDGWQAVEDSCGFMAGIDEFDSLFFEISPREADGMDPRQRLLLEECWKALEDAGQTPALLSACSVGTFVGVEEGDYQRLVPRTGHADVSITSQHNGILAGRLAYFLDLHGPTLAVNTACSSGLVALHQACQSLRAGECDTAIVASAHVMATPHGLREMGDAGMLSSQGRCMVFDERADGMVPGEAVVVLVLKRASRARRDNDRIRALVAGSGINSDGRTNGITAPNGVAQAMLIESVYRRYGIDAARIDYVIAHGTGTKLGDPVEVNALSDAFRALTPRVGYCALGSVKPNFGHTLAASGLVSVVALAEALRHDTIPASLNWARPNPFVQWQGSPFFVNGSQRSWHPVQHPRQGAVSAFGMSGTNAHVVLQEFTAPGRPALRRQQAYLFVLSAKTEKALQQRRADMAAFFDAMAHDAASQVALADVSYTLLERRHHFVYRCAIVAGSAEEVAGLLRAEAGVSSTGCMQGRVGRGFRPEAAQQQRAESLRTSVWACNEDASQLKHVLGALAGLYCQGYAVRMPGTTADGLPLLTSLPAYPFAPVRHWLRQAVNGSAVFTQSAPMCSVMSPPAPDAADDVPAAPSANRTVLLTPVWDVEELAVSGNASASRGRLLVIGDPTDSVRAVLDADPEAVVLGTDLADGAQALDQALDLQQPFARVVWFVPPSTQCVGDAVIECQQQGVLAGFRLIKTLVERGYGDSGLDLTVITEHAQAISRGDAVRAVHAGVHGMVGSLAKERPNWKIRLVDLSRFDTVPLAEVLALPSDRRGHAWAYRHGEWYRRRLVMVQPNGHYPSPYRDGGIYIVIGGAGDIGEAWTEHVMRRHGARVVWVGRRALNADIEARLNRLAGRGPQPLYLRADASRREDMQVVRDTVLSMYGAVHGVVHGAMAFSSQDLIGMTEPLFLSALRAKVDVCVRIAQVFANDALDFLLFFSSMISLIKNARQAHYAAGCTFKDAFARQFARDVAYPVKVVNWGYWAAKKNADAREVQLLTELGMGLIECDEGMRALDVLLGAPLDQLGVMSLARDMDIEGLDTDETMEIYAAD